MPNMIQNAKDSISQILNAAYQKAAGLTVDGVAGRMTWAAIERALA